MLKLQFKDNPQRSLWLVDEKLTLGSEADNDIMLNGLGIDAFHASLSVAATEVILECRNGSCYVNDIPVDSGRPLIAGDELRIGQHRMLILTPREADQLQKAAKDAVTTSTGTDSGTGWSLHAEHAKLKDQDYLIAKKSVLGRSRDCDLAVPYKLLSRHHAEFSVRDGQLYLKDLGSSNGSFVNGKRVNQARLQSGDKISFAKLLFTVTGPAVDAGINRTMVRPAIDINHELKKMGGKQEPGALVPAATENILPVDSESRQASERNMLLPVMGLGLILLVFASFWLFGR